MKVIIIILILLITFAFTTQWQTPIAISYTGDDPCFTFDNQKMYTSVTDGSPTSNNIGYNNWNGSAWVWGGDVYGDIRTATYNEEEPFVTYDNQIMYFVRAQKSGAWSQIYKATREGSTEVFNGSTPLGSQINNINGQPFADYPSLTQDQQKLYFTAFSGSYWKIFEATWNGSDWDNVVMLPDEVNEGDSTYNNRMHVCVTPDGSELYFMLSSGGGGGRVDLDIQNMLMESGSSGITVMQI